VSQSFTRLVCAALFVLSCVWFADATGRPTVIVTIDVETTENLPLPQQIDMVCAGGVHCGLLQIARALEQHRMAGTFFLNVYEYKYWGESALRNLARELQSRGHDVALHTHPHWAYDPERPYLYDYTLDEQTRIVADGVRLLTEWTGLPVVAHRAGAYSANRDSLEALARNGIVIDASLFPGEPHCRLNGLGLPVNFPGLLGTVTEIPVTVYERRERPSGLGRLLPAYVALGKIDVNSIDSEHQATTVLNAVTTANPPFIIIFLHSFSFVAAPGQDNRAPAANERAMRVFAALIDGISANHLTVVTAREVASQRNLVVFDGNSSKTFPQPALPRVELVVPTVKYGARMLRSSTGIWLGAVLVALIAAATGLWALGRRSLAVRKYRESS
jgi:peptidoglycan/xylan/chitin deacetylase (PgdA/CDA1 family)